ncbi:MAG: retropepsin-like domain-containing protein [Ignavibacteriae bacterium]|nr:retropepsin-like domain-containing protein [Ignavibacteriota bacterium]
MRSIKFDYSYYKGTHVPIIPIEIKQKNTWFRLWAFVDSGATYSLFSIEEAHTLGLDLHDAHKRYIVVGDGSFIPALFVKIKMRIGYIEHNVEVGFSDKLGIGFNLLGRKDVFEQFKVCLSDKEKVVSFHPYT